jgi:hypothetical protein
VGDRDERQEREAGDESLHAQLADGAPLEGDVGQQVQRGTAGEGGGRLPLERVTHVGEGALHPEGDEHDGAHHRQV